jgi:hypothetical protein
VAGDEDDGQRVNGAPSGGLAAPGRSCLPCGCRRSGSHFARVQPAKGTTRRSRSTSRGSSLPSSSHCRESRTASSSSTTYTVPFFGIKLMWL